MSTVDFDRDSQAKWYARQHLKTDPGIRSIYYLPTNSSQREIRLLEINELIAERLENTLEPIDFGVDADMDTQHKLFVLDVTPAQWEKIQQGALELPQGWSLKDAVPYKSEVA